MSERRLKWVHIDEMQACTCTVCAWALEIPKNEIVKAREAFRQHDCADYPATVPVELAKAASS
jgi:hypothetical protein